MAVEYFPCVIRLEDVDCYVIWYSDESGDGLVREGGRVLTFSSLAQLQDHARSRGLTIRPEEVARYDWDSIERWCDEPAATGIAPGPFLNAWNMVVDAFLTSEQSSLFSHADGRNGALYEKLFRANNLPAMTAPGADYYPVWTRGEVDALAQVLRLGIAAVRQQLGGGGAV